MASIFELTELEKELDSKLFCLDETDESDTDAIKLIMRQLESVHAKIENRLLWAAKMEQGTRAHAEAIKAVNKARKKEEERAFRIADFWAKYVGDGLEANSIESVEDAEIRACFRKNPPSVVIANDFDIRHLPYDCFKIVPEQYVPDKNAIKEILNQGVELEGISLVSNKTLRIS